MTKLSHADACCHCYRNEYLMHLSDTVIINTGMSTCVFINPSIPETDEYKARFNKPCHAPKILTAPAGHHQPAPDLQDQDIITVSALNLQSGKKDKSPTFTCKAKITGFTIRDEWYYLACPTCSKSLRFNSGKLCCGHHGEQIGHPILEDEDDSTTATIVGKAADNLFGVTCEELVNEQGEDDKHNIQLAIQKAKNTYRVWQIGYGIRDDFVVKDVYPQNEDDEQMAVENTTPQVQTPTKRAMQPREDATLKELLNIEMKKKQKSTITIIGSLFHLLDWIEGSCFRCFHLYDGNDNSGLEMEFLLKNKQLSVWKSDTACSASSSSSSFWDPTVALELNHLTLALLEKYRTRDTCKTASSRCIWRKDKWSYLTRTAYVMWRNRRCPAGNVWYAKVGNLELAYNFFKQMPRRDLVSWNSLISGHAKRGEYDMVIKVFHNMVTENVRPDNITLVSLVSAAAEIGALDKGKWMHGLILRMQMKIDAFLGSALIDMYCKAGSLERAFLVFRELTEKDVTVWTTLITGFAFHGHGRKALDLFSEMQRFLLPSGVTIVAVLTACSHSGLVEEGLSIFNRRLVEAKDVLENMPIQPSRSIWGAMLSACRVHGNMELAEIASTELLKLEPEEEGGYILLSNIYAACGRWSSSDKIREIMEAKGVKKTAGCSSVVVDGVIHDFVAADKRHPRWEDLFHILLCLKSEMKLDDTDLANFALFTR
ncbi:hypothetical protein ACLB2K_061103 [Fragaria x ananassa]